MNRSSPLRRFTPLRRAAMKPWHRKPADRVPEWLFGFLLARDKTCRAPSLGATDACNGRLTIEHVKDVAAVGKRAPSDPDHTLLLCLAHNIGWALTSAAKEAERAYLRRVTGERAA